MPKFVVRPIKLEDAADFNGYRKRIADEPNNNLALSKGEYLRTVEEEYERIQDIINDSEKNIFVAEIEGKIIGACSCRGLKASSLRHSVGLGIDVDPNYRGQGIGNALMQAMIDWARPHPVICRVELDVFTYNHRAIGLYLKHGFVFEGLKRKAFFKYGQWVDAYLMALVLDKD